MTSQTTPQNCPKFTLRLKSHTSRKRISEAKTALAGLYPFEINEKKLLTSKTGIKGQYDVYLLKEEIKQPKEDIDDDKDMDKSFYTKSLNLTDDLEGLDDKKESKTNKVLLRIFLIVAIVAIVVVGAVLVYTFLKK